MSRMEQNVWNIIADILKKKVQYGRLQGLISLNVLLELISFTYLSQKVKPMIANVLSATEVATLSAFMALT